MNLIKRKYFFLYSRLKYGLHPKPLYILRTIRNLILSKIYKSLNSKHFVLRGIDFAITYACNFNCNHCYAKRLMNRRRRMMTPADYGRICEEAMKLGVVTFSLQGGEPLLHKDLKEIIKAFQPHKNHVIMTTNASLLNEEKIKELKSTGLDSIYFSLDSGIAEEHDKFRKHEGNFNHIMECIKWCKKYGLKVVINTCVSKHNIHSPGFRKILDFTHKNRLLIEVLFPRPLGNWEGQYDALLTEEDVKFFNDLMKDYPFVVRDLSNNYREYGCPALKEYFYITTYGDVCPCPFTHVILGNIFEESLKDIRERGLKIKWWNHYHPVCLTARDKEFMELYYPLANKNPLIKLKEFK